MRLFIRILPASEPVDPGMDRAVDTIPCQWLLRDDHGHTLARGESTAKAIEDGIQAAPGVAGVLADPENIVVLAPASHVVWLSRTVPGRRTSQIRRALPFAVEESLTQDVETMHIAHGPIIRGQPVRCALVDRQSIADWLACLQDGGVQPGYMVPDACLLPCGESSASVLFDGAEALVRTSDHIASVEASTLPHILESIRASFGETDAPLQLELIGGQFDDGEADTGDFSVRETPLGNGVLDYLASQWEADGSDVNLLQGPFAPSRPKDASRSGWRGVAALAALWLILTLAVLIAEGLVADRRANVLEAESTALYQSIYPNERRVPNAYAQMRAKLRQSDGGQVAFHLLLGQIAAGTVQENAEISVRSLTFNDSRGELTSELWLPDYAQIDRLKRELEERGLSVDISSAEERDNVVRARLRISLAGGLPG